MRLAALDMGTNSFHLLVVDAHVDGTFEPLVREKEMLRLGDVVSRHGRIPESAMRRAVTVVERFKSLADAAGADEIAACATSATREAENGDELVDQILERTGIEVQVISGVEEARLIFEAVRASLVIEPPPALAFDLGGGSLEVMVGDRQGLRWSTSVKLGVARLTTELVRDDPPSAGDIRRLRDRVSSQLAPLAAEVADLHPRMVVGTSGTLCTLARMVAARRASGTKGSVPVSVNQLTFDRDELTAIHDQIVGLKAADRARLPGLDAGRADIIAAGSTLLLNAMELFGFERMTVSEWALREGILLDRIRRHDRAELGGDTVGIRRASVLELCRRCNWDELHSRQVARLALSIFDQSASLHGLGPADRELLEHACLLHDIGAHVSTEAHHKHTAYLIEHGRLRGFTPEEVAILAALGRYHRGGDPRPSKPALAAVSEGRRADVAKLVSILRVADGLDRSRGAAVAEVSITLTGDWVRLVASANGDIDVDLWGARRKRDLFENLFDRRLEVLGV